MLPGLSVHPPAFIEEVNDLVFDEDWCGSDFSYRRIDRLRDFLARVPVREKPEYQVFGGHRFRAPRTVLTRALGQALVRRWFSEISLLGRRCRS
ncbi:hypothetical protein GCM10009689_26380 [Brevibacterium antiquum]